MAASLNVIQIPQIREIFACGIQTPGKFCLLNPESWVLESGISFKESRIQVPLTNTGIEYLESKTVLDSLDSVTRDELLDSGYYVVDCLHHPSLSVTNSACKNVLECNVQSLDR